ncbi:LamG domain-containing protein [Pseudolysinimonas sp.]|uniref:LamG domain-containing protein n=1 Tax=Pseudolysinimonas sp. TaxID=2680009 RepID=UPI00286B16FF|nr:LamG domain-containing protein [Pseudolysinimonas sp.]
MTTTTIAQGPARHLSVTARWRRTLLFAIAAFALVLVGGAAWSYWLAAVTAGSAGSALATSVNAGATPTANASGANVTVSWSASTLTNGMAVSGYEIRRYNSTTLVQQTILSACTGTVTALSCVENSVPSGTWRYSVTPVIGTNWRGAESAMSTVVTVDTIAPINSLTLSSITGGASLTGTTVYYRGTAVGSFTLTNALTDGGTGPASSQTAALGGTTTGWTHTPSTVSTPTGGPYVSNTFSWAAATTGSPTEAVVGRDVIGNTATTNLTFTNDSTAPAVGTISYINGTQPGKSVSVTFTTGTDGGAGIVTRQLQRAQVAFTSGACGTPYSAFANIGPGLPTSPYVDTTVVNSYCYMYQYVVTDGVGNQSITTTTDVSLIDYGGAVAVTSGLISRWRLGDASTAGVMDDNGPNNNDGTFFNNPTGGVTGAPPNDADTAVLFDGVNDYATAARQIAGDFSIEFWFKTSQYAGFGCDQWWRGHGLVDAEVSGATWDFGVSLCAGRIVAGVGTPDVSIVSAPNLHNNAWHHVVFTRTQSTGALALYVDGALSGTASGNTQPLNASTTLTFGRQATGIQYYAGLLDEVAVYSSVLSPTTVTNHYQLGSSVATDVTGPTGGSVDASGLVGTGARYSTSPNLSIVFTPGTDSSGLLTTGRTLTRATATLTAGTCGTYGAYALVTGGTDPTSPKADTVTTGACYRYKYTVADTLGNSTTYTSGDIKVDSTAPSAPTLAISSPVNSYWSGSGSTVYYNSGAASGSFAVTGSSTDAQSGIASYAYPAAGTNWTSTPGSLGVNTYSWSGAPAAPGTLNVTATNNAGTASATSPLTFVADTSAPTAGTVSYVNGIYADTTISVSFTTGTDAGSGVGTRLLQRATATLTGTTCGAYGAFVTVTGGTNPTSPVVDTVATSGACYMYRYVVSDNLGLQHIATSANVARSPGAIWALNEGSGASAADTSGNARTATLQAGATWTTRPTGMSTTPAVNLTGATNSFVQFDGPAVDTNESHTVAAWVRLSSLVNHRTFAVIDGTNINPFYLQMTNLGQFNFSQRTSDSTAATLIQVNGLSPAVNTWYHVAGVYDKQAGTIQLYVDGVSQGTAVAGPSWTATGSTAIGRGKWGGANVDFVAGALDEVRFYGRVLSAAEIAALAAG